jgi:hypothetical protein
MVLPPSCIVDHPQIINRAFPKLTEFWEKRPKPTFPHNPKAAFPKLLGKPPGAGNFSQMYIYVDKNT